MGAPGLEPAVEEAAHRIDECRPHLVLRARDLSRLPYRHARAARRRPADRRVDDAARRGERAPHERHVPAIDRSRRDLLDEAVVGDRRARDHEQPARVAIEPVHDAGTVRVADRRELGKPREQAVHQRPAARDRHRDARRDRPASRRRSRRRRHGGRRSRRSRRVRAARRRAGSSSTSITLPSTSLWLLLTALPSMTIAARAEQRPARRRGSNR